MPRRRGRKKKFRLSLRFDMNPDVVKSVFAVLLGLLGLLALVSFFAPGYSVNSRVHHWLLSGLGWPSFLLPFAFFLASTFFIDSLKFRFKNLRVFIGLLALTLTLATFLMSFCWTSSPYSLASQGSYGGLVGYRLFFKLHYAFGFIGAVLTSFTLLLISVLILSNLTLDVLVTWLLSHFKLPAFPTRASSETANTSQDKVFPEDITIGDMARMSFGSLDDLATSKSAVDSEPIEEPRIEILPPPAEPQGEISPVDAASPVVKPLEDTFGDSSPGLPYADRVWQLPPLSILEDSGGTAPDVGNIKARSQIIESTLRSFGIRATVKESHAGPSVTQYVIDTSSGTKVSKIVNLQSDLALALASPTGTVRVEAPIPGRAYIGIEVPNNNRVIVPFKELLTSEPMRSLSSKLGIVLGKDVGGHTHVYRIDKMPHLLVAGATGSGKSVFLHSLLFSLLYRATPQEVKFILVDPKRVELTYYEGIPHLLTPVVTDINKAVGVLKWAVLEMDRRYKLFESAHARNIDSYNEKSGFQALPYIVIVLEEFGEIMLADPANIEKLVIRLGQLGRAAGIHLVLALQRPSADVITGLIKANIPCRVAFKVSSQVDSRVIINQPGAEKLLGKGDMLFYPQEASKPFRLQGAFVREKEITALVSFLKSQGVEPDYKEEIDEIIQEKAQEGKSISSGGSSVDPLFDDAVAVCVSAGKASASLLQRRLSIGYARAARILDELEARGIVGPRNGSQPRDVLVSSADYASSIGDFS